MNWKGQRWRHRTTRKLLQWSRSNRKRVRMRAADMGRRGDTQVPMVEKC